MSTKNEEPTQDWYKMLFQMEITQFYHSEDSSVRPNTEYSAEYSAKMIQIFGTEYSAESADTPILENGAKMAVFHPFQT